MQVSEAHVLGKFLITFLAAAWVMSAQTEEQRR